MYFGDYLVEKKIISTEQLVTALCVQLESLPSLIRIVMESNLINANEMLGIIKKQIEEDSDILTVLIKENKLSALKRDELELVQMSKKIPLGEVLVNLKYSKLDTINSALTEFFANNYNTKIEEAHTFPELEVSSAALESLRELGMSMDGPSNPFINQYLELFSEKFKNKLIKLIEILQKESSGSSDISNYFNSLYRDLHLLKSTIAISELKTHEEIITVWENQIEKILTKNNEEIRSWCLLKLSLLHETILLFWNARDIILKEQSDDSLVKDQNFLASINNILDKVS